MNLCRFEPKPGEIHVGLMMDDSTIADLVPAGLTQMEQLLESRDPAGAVRELYAPSLPRVLLTDASLRAPVERQEVWAAGVTYKRSRTARMDESTFSADAYERVYEAARPELFFKALPEKLVAPGEPVGIRRDARWSVPEPELALVLNSRGQTVAYTIGNDMSSRDIEAENLLYLPQAKIYSRSCALGPWLKLGVPETVARQWTVRLDIRRAEHTVFAGRTEINQVQRRFEDLVEFLFRSQVFPHGAVLLTGTGIVPPDSFTLQAGDVVEIEVSGIGRLTNPVVVV